MPSKLPTTARKTPTLKQARFIRELAKDGNASAAGRRAGYSPKSASAQGRQNLRKPTIKKAVERMLVKADLSAARVLEELRRLSFVDPRGFWDKHGNLVPIHLLSEQQAASLAGFEAIIKNAQAGDGVTDLVHKIKIIEKTKSLEILAKYFGLLIERVQVENIDAKLAGLDEGRRRNAEAAAADRARKAAGK